MAEHWSLRQNATNGQLLLLGVKTLVFSRLVNQFSEYTAEDAILNAHLITPIHVFFYFFKAEKPERWPYTATQCASGRSIKLLIGHTDAFYNNNIMVYYLDNLDTDMRIKIASYKMCTHVKLCVETFWSTLLYLCFVRCLVCVCVFVCARASLPVLPHGTAWHFC